MLKISGTLDIECSDWDRFAVACLYDGHRPKIFYDPDDMLDELRRRGGTYWAHAGGVYDLMLILELARVRGIACQVDRSQHRVTRIVMGNLTLRDSYALWPAPLDEICGALGRPVPHLPWKCMCGLSTCDCGCGGCGGYCRIGDKARLGDPDLEDYVKADAKSLYDGLILLGEFCIDQGIDLRGTMGMTAWLAAQAELGVPDSTMSWPMWRHCRKADKGGRVVIAKPRMTGPGAHHDICNAYPAQLAKAHLPVGSVRELGADHAMRALSRQRPGVYTMTVRVPSDSFLPPLPWAKAGMLAFPTGEIAGTWTLPEIACALERNVEILAVHGALIWEATAQIFAPVIERWYAIRRKVGRKTPLGQWMGRLPKALTGKFAERPERQRVTMHPESIRVCTRKGRCRDGCTKRCGAYEQLDLDGAIWGIPYQHLGSSSYPQWSSYLRAMTRVQWLEQAERFTDRRDGRGKLELAFGNTDSLWHCSRESPEPLGDNLGQWEYQHQFCDLEVRSPQVYAYREQPGAKLQIRGVPGLTEEDWKRGAGTIDRGIVTFGRAVKNGDGLFRKRVRRWTLPEQDRAYYLDRKIASDGITYPLDAKELVELSHRMAEMKRVRENRETLTSGPMRVKSSKRSKARL